MSKAIEFIFDFASPNAYLAHWALKEVARRTGARIVIAPALLGGIFKATGNQAPMQAFAGVKGKLAYEHLETQRFIKAHNLHRFRMNPHFPLNSLASLRGLMAAQGLGVEEPYLEAVLTGFWEDGLKMDEPSVLVGVLERAGLDGEAVVAAAAEPSVKAALQAMTEGAVARGVFGVPSFFVGGEMFFGKERIGQVEAAVASQV